MIDDLINKIVKNENIDDDFVRMTFLVLLGTVIAPVSHEYIPKEYYALVKDKGMISKFNWNKFTLKFFLSEIEKVLEDGRVTEWPHGNLALFQRMIEKMNKTGVFYRTSNMEEEENLYDDINESTNDGAFGHKEFVYQSDMDDSRTPSQDYLNSFKDDWSDPIKGPNVSDEKAVTSLDTNEISSHGSGHYNGVDEQVEKGLGKRKCTASRAVKSLFVVVKPIKRAKHSAKAKLFNKEDVKKTSADVDVIKAGVMFLWACER
ncbi:hypothetical protein D1007_06675 [Hordeum vulgare]|nr:hypothetical protein D1007_06675 [Hordeum vulgare]